MASNVASVQALAFALLSAAALVQTDAEAAATCTAQSGRKVAEVIELYTSEGCSSCPPADQWLSTLKGGSEVVAMAFHVDYWNRLGWNDRFSSALFTQRQSQQEHSSGGRFSYTPQVTVDGADRKDWRGYSPDAKAPDRPAASVALSATRIGERITATVTPMAGAPHRLAAYWAVTEQAHVTAVKAGENDGVTLHHDHVVREYKVVDAWQPMAPASQTLVYDVRKAADPAHPRQINLVVLNADTGRPVQALKLGC